ncbi:tetratricopeptide repeat protein [bacterium]|nr:tetratricopeptide repeat protein [bacterium]
MKHVKGLSIFLVFVFFFCLLMTETVIWAQPPVPKEAEDKAAEAATLMHENNYKKAAELLEQAISYSKYYIGAYIDLCTCYSNLEQYDQAKDICKRAIELNPNYNSQPHSVLGEILYKEENYQEALVYLMKSISLNKKQSKIHNLIGLCYLKQEDMSAAVSSFRDAIKFSKDNFEANFYLANTLYQIQNFKESQEVYEECLKINPKNLVVYYKLASAYQEDGNIEKTIDTYKRFLKHYPQNMAGLLKLGETYYKANDTKSALETFQEVLKISPDQAESYFFIGNIYRDDKQYDQAMENYNKALELNPALLEGYVSRSALFKRSGKYEQALSDLREAERVDPSSEEIKTGIADCYVSLGQLDQAGLVLSQIVESNPRNGIAVYNLGRIQLKQGRTQEAIKYFSDALQLDVDHVPILNDRAIANIRLRQYDQAQSDWAEALRMDSTNTAVQINSAVLKVQEKKYDEALTVLNQLLTDGVRSGPVHHALANCYYGQGNLDQAKEHYEQALEIDPGLLQTKINLANILLDQKKNDEAKILLDQVSAAALSDDMEIQRYLADAYARAALYDEAVTHYSAAQQISQSPELVFNLSYAQLKSGQYQAASDLLTKEIDAGVKDYAILNNLALALYNLDQPEKALEYLKEASAEKPEIKQLIVNQALVHYTLGNYRESIKLYQQAGNEDGTEGSVDSLSNALFNRGNILLGQKRYPQALTEYAKALEITPENPALHNNIGVVHLKQNDLESALPHLEKCVQIDPTLAECIVNLGIYYERTGEPAKAYNQFVQYLQTKPRGRSNVEQWVQTYKRIYHYE